VGQWCSGDNETVSKEIIRQWGVQIIRLDIGAVGQFDREGLCESEAVVEGQRASETVESRDSGREILLRFRSPCNSLT
jgi:hypothetical protein